VKRASADTPSELEAANVFITAGASAKKSGTGT